jgi:hypothetical protein
MIASTTLAVAIVPIFFVKIMEFFHKNKNDEDDEEQGALDEPRS